MSTASDQEYSPDTIASWLSGRCPNCRWSFLESSVEGGAGCPGGGHGNGSRQILVDFKTDLERAADHLPIYWQATKRIFSKQHRYSVWLARWTMAGSPTDGPDQEPIELNAAFELAVWKMARTLGWEDGLTSAA